MNFTSDEKQVRLSDILSVRTMTKEESESISRIADMAFDVPLFSPAVESDISEFAVVVDRYFEQGKQAGNWTGDTTNLIGQVVTLLRLLDRGNLGIFFVESAQILGGQVSEPHSWTYDPTLVPARARGDYNLTTANAEVLTELWEELQPVRSQTTMFKRRDVDLAASRFNSAYAREEIEDQLIDLVIGFETLLILERDELAYRLAHRVSLLLGKNDTNRKEIREYMRSAYSTRSKIVHGAEAPMSVRVLDSEVSLGEFVDGIERLLARAILTVALLSREIPRSELISTIDAALISGSARSALEAKIAGFSGFLRGDSSIEALTLRKEPSSRSF